MQIIILEDKDEYLKRFGATVKRLRLYHDMTMQELADRCGYSSRATINKIEKGEINVTQSKMKALATALGVSPVELIGDNEDKAAYRDLFGRLDRLSDGDRRKALKMIDSIIEGFEE